VTSDFPPPDAAATATRSDLSVVVSTPTAEPGGDLVRESLVVNGRSGRRGWRLRLSLSFDPEVGDHVWMSALTEPSRPGSFSGVWLVPVGALRAALTQRVSLGSVTIEPVDSGERLFLEAMTAGKPWTVSVPLPWVRRYLDRIDTAG
jgi:hypothetical protein